MAGSAPRCGMKPQECRGVTGHVDRLLSACPSTAELDFTASTRRWGRRWLLLRHCRRSHFRSGRGRCGAERVCRRRGQQQQRRCGVRAASGAGGALLRQAPGWRRGRERRSVRAQEAAPQARAPKQVPRSASGRQQQRRRNVAHSRRRGRGQLAHGGLCRSCRVSRCRRGGCGRPRRSEAAAARSRDRCGCCGCCGCPCGGGWPA